MRRVALLTPALALACAQVLSYDDYTARPDDSSVVADSAADVVAETTGETSGGPARPPLRPAGPATPSGKGKQLWVAVKRMYIGSMSSLGVSSSDAWREWGYDIDQVCTSAEDSIANIGTCKRHPEAKQDFLTDGIDCRDNNFGHHIVGLLSVSSEGFEARINEGILEGSSTWLIRIDDLDDGVDDAYAPGKLYRSQGERTGKFKWDGTDVRKVLSDSVIGGDLEKSIGEFPKGYVRNNVWVSGDPQQRELVLPVSGSLFVPLHLDAAILTAQLDPDHRGGKRGIVAGAIPAGTIETLMKPIATESGFCPGTTLYNTLLRTVQRFPDVVIGAPNLQDTSRECDGISIGLGFDLAPIQPVTEIVPPPPPGKDACADGGVADTGAPDTGVPDTGVADTKSDTKADGS